MLIPARLDNLLDAAAKERLQARICAIAKKWKLQLEPPFQPGGYTAWAAGATLADQTRAVLKVQAVLAEGQDDLLERVYFEVLALKAWSGKGAVKLLDYQADALLLEYLKSNTKFSDLTQQSRQAITSGLLPTIWLKSNLPTVPTIESLLEFRRDQLALFAKQAPLPVFNQAWEKLSLLWPALYQLSKREHYLLHGDLHQENFFCRSQGWIVIDPSPLIGPRSYDLEPLGREYLDKADSADYLEFVDFWQSQGIALVKEFALGRSFFHAWQSYSNQDMNRVELWGQRIEKLIKLIP